MSRLQRLWCLIWYGHAQHAVGRLVTRCPRCGGEIVGPH